MPSKFYVVVLRYAGAYRPFGPYDTYSGALSLYRLLQAAARLEVVLELWSIDVESGGSVLLPPPIAREVGL